MEARPMNNIFYVKDYRKDGVTDSEAISACLKDANLNESRTIVFDGKDYYLDEAVVLDSRTHVIIDNCALRQNDLVFDNIFRGANVIVDPDAPYGYPLEVGDISDIKIEGRGDARLVGTLLPRVAYHPGKDEYQRMTGDFWGWRTLMIQFAMGKNIEISGIALSHTMCWAITFEFCTEVYVHDVDIVAKVKNGDGIDFRSGCHHCRVENITGYTSDDTVACTALQTTARGVYPNKKSVYPITVTGGLTRGLSTDIHDITVKGIKTGGLCHGMICLAANGNKVYDIDISDFDEAPDGARTSTVCIYTGYGTGYTAGDISNISIKNIHARQSRYALEIRADIRNITADGIVNDNAFGSDFRIYPKYDRKYNYRIGISTCGYPVENTDDAYFSALRDGHISDLELSAKNDNAFRYDFKKLDELAWRYGINLWSLHLPFMPFAEIDISKPSLAEDTVKRLSELIRRAATEARITKFVIHPSGEPIEDSERRERMECAKKSLKALAEVAAEYGAVIAVENLPRTCLGNNSEEMLELLSADKRLRSCFDTNHLLSESHEDYIKAVSKYMVTSHVSDYDFIDERHLLPGEGKVDWQKLLSDLSENGYAGIWLYELSFGASTRIKRERDLTPADFSRNAVELFSGEEPTLIEREYLF